MTSPIAANENNLPPDAVIRSYDTALFDLDGVVYLGPDPVPAAVDGLARLRRAGVRLGYVTNNAARPPQVIVDHLRQLGVELGDEDVITSAQAAAQLLRERFGAGARVLAVGTLGVDRALAEAGLVGVHSADDDPVAVIQGYAPDLSWTMITEAALAIRRGAYWMATNTDPTRPSERGLVPGNGAAVAAVRAAVDVEPAVAGKPDPPLITEALRRTGGTQAIFVGDRLDTDINGAAAAGLDSMLVLSGAHQPADLVVATGNSRPTHLGLTLAALAERARAADVSEEESRCNAMRVVAVGRRAEAASVPQGIADELDLVWALAQLCWQRADRGRPLDPAPVLAGLTHLR